MIWALDQHPKGGDSGSTGGWAGSSSTPQTSRIARMCRVLTCATHFERWRGVRMNVHTGSAICDAARGWGALALQASASLSGQNYALTSRNRVVEQNSTICYIHNIDYY